MGTSKTILIRDDSTHEIVLAIDERTATANERLKAQFSKVDTKIHRFPRGLHGIGGDSHRYIVPSVVAIGPYHHGSPHLQKMEEVKFAAAYHLCKHSGRSTSMEVYEKILSVVGDARGCYDADDPSVAGLSDADFATMMFLDGCFLLQYMVGGGDEPVLQNRMTLSTGLSIQRDIFLLENQIPWVVLQVLREFMPVDVRRFVAGMQEKFHPGKAKEKDRWWMHWGSTTSTPMPPDEKKEGSAGRGVSIGSDADDYTPPHLLGLLWYTQVGSMPAHVKNYRGFVSSLKSSSAVELAEIGVKLTPSKEPWFGDMTFRRCHLFGGELSLSPVFLNDITAFWLVNIAALEASTSGASPESDGYTVSSYLSVLAMLMDREEDVQKLRAKTLLYSTFSDKQALGFFKGLARHLRFGDRYFATLEAIYSYRRHCSVLIFFHRHLYNGYKAMTIATLFSIVGVLVGIFKTMLSKQKP
jgi:hypothetical protein